VELRVVLAPSWEKRQVKRQGALSGGGSRRS
jgi:hypothetical protein